MLQILASSQGSEAGVLGAMLVFIIVCGLAGILVGILYLLTLYRAIARCAPESQAMAPGLVWLQLIPVFNLVWQFFNVINVAKSLEKEFQRRNISAPPRPGQGLGITMCVLLVCGIIPIVGIVTSIAGVVCWIIYWVKIAGFSKQLETRA